MTFGNKPPVVVNGITYYGPPPTADDTTPAGRSDTDTWHDRKTPRKGCLHCADGDGRGHYFCTEAEPCGDCVDEGLTAAENVAAGYGPHGEDTGSEHDYSDYYD
jgi:hypothetical protein